MKVVKRIANGMLTLMLALSIGFVVFRSQDIRDWWVLRGYTPSSEVQQISKDTTMTSFGQRLFYVYDPQIEPSDKFNSDCTIAESSIILGCYDGRGIYVYNVTDPRLAGVHGVTAAHEMLHAAYDRLNPGELENINELTARELAKLTDARLLAVVASYRSRDPSIVSNELHSILGTEVRNLSPELEAHYKKYFTNRLAVVKLSEKYEQVFTDNKTKVERYDAELALIKSQIDGLEKDLQTRANKLQADKAELDRLEKSNNAAEFNSKVPAYNSGVNNYNSDLETYKNLINDYNQKVVERNALTLEQNSLIKSLDSKAQTL